MGRPRPGRSGTPRMVDIGCGFSFRLFAEVALFQICYRIRGFLNLNCVEYLYRNSIL